MPNVSLRYYKKPKNQNIKKLSNSYKNMKNKPLKFLVLLAIIILISSFFYFIPRTYISKVNDVSVLLEENDSTFLVSKTGPFYANYENKILISNKIDDSNLINLGKVESQKDVKIGTYQNFVFFQFPHNPYKTITLNPKYLNNPNITVNLKDEYDTNNFKYELDFKEDKIDYTILNNDQIIYQPNNIENKCSKKLNSNILECSESFNESSIKIMNIKVRDNDNKLYEVTKNRIITFLGGLRINCKFQDEPKVGDNKVICISPIDSEVFIQDKSYKLEMDKEQLVTVNAKAGKNNFLIAGKDKAGKRIEQLITYEVITSFYFDLAPSKDNFPLESPNNIEFILNTNENVKMDIYANASDSEKGYQNFNSDPIDTKFSNILYENKNIEFTTKNNMIVLQIDTRSNDNKDKKDVYPSIINVNFIAKTETSKNVQASCKIIIKVNESIKDKSSCKIKNII